MTFKSAAGLCVLLFLCALFASFSHYKPEKLEPAAISSDDGGETPAPDKPLVRLKGRVGAFGTGERPVPGIILADDSAVYGILPAEKGELLLGQQGFLIEFEGELLPPEQTPKVSVGERNTSRASDSGILFPDGILIIRSWRVVE